MEEDNFIEEKKDFFNLMDYGYIAQIVDDEEQRKMQKSMNEIFRRKKMEDLDDLD